MDEKKLMAILDSITFGAIPSDRHRPKRRLPEAYPDYSKSIVQGKGDPVTSGILRGLGFGGLGAAIGGGTASIMKQSPQTQVLMAILGGLAGGGLGYHSGSSEQESDNSKLLFLRRMGINNPGELEAAETYPTLARKLTDEGGTDMRSIPWKGIKGAISQLGGEGTGAMLARGAIGAPVGYAVGKHVTPGVFGYEGDEGATNMSSALDSILFGLAAAGAPKMIRHMGKAKGSDSIDAFKGMVGAGGAMVGSELVPIGAHAIGQGAGAAKQTSKSMRELAESAKGIRPNPSMSSQIQDILGSSPMRGAGVGAGLAGLGAMGTGLLRSQTDGERRDGTSRAGMVGSDFLKYVIPAVLAGGTLGHVAG